MSDRYSKVLADHLADKVGDPAYIAAQQKQHKQEQKELRDWHAKYGTRLISGRREALTSRIESLEEQLTEMKAEWATIKNQLSRGRLSTSDYRKQARVLMEARERIPEEIDAAVADLDAVTDLDPVQTSGSFLERFPALRNAAPSLPEPSSNGRGSD